MFEAKLPIIPRQPAIEALHAVLPLAAQERVLNVVGPQGGEGKTWALLGLQKHCADLGLSHNEQVIDFYDTAHQRVSGVMESIVAALDPDSDYFAAYRQKRDEFNKMRFQRCTGQALSAAGRELDRIFANCLRQLGRARRRDGQRGVVLFFDTWEVVKEGRISEWLRKELLPAAEDIVVVIGGRQPLLDAATDVPVRYYQPDEFTLDEIQAYVRVILGQQGVLDDEAVRRLAVKLLRQLKGTPILVALALDTISLRLKHRDVDVGSLPVDSIVEGLSALDEASAETQLVEELINQLKSEPAQQWAVLYMAHFRRRFNKDIYAFLHGQPAGGTSILQTFQGLYAVKYRELGWRHLQTVGPEVSALLHDRIRTDVAALYWHTGIPQDLVMPALGKDLFPEELATLWWECLDRDPERTIIPAVELRPIVDWLNRRIHDYYARQQDYLQARQRATQAENPSLAVELMYRRQALVAEQLLYELDQDLDVGWERWRRTYYAAFESFQQGFCEQLELTVLSAWSTNELQADPRKHEILEMVKVRQQWWKIQGAPELRDEAIKYLTDLVAPHTTDSDDDRGSELLADVHGALGWAYSLEGDTRRSLRHRQRAAAISRRLGLLWNLAFQLDFLGESYDSQGDFEAADAAWQESLALARQLDPPDDYRIAAVAMKWAYSLNVRGQPEVALAYARTATELFKELGDERSLGLALNYMGRIYQAMGKYRHARNALRTARELCDLSGGKDDQVRLLISEGELSRRRIGTEYELAGDRESAQHKLGLAATLARENDFGTWQTEAEGELGAFYRDESRRLLDTVPEDAAFFWQEANDVLTAALKAAREQGTKFKEADLLDDMADLYMPPFSPPDADQRLAEVLAELEALGDKPGFLRYASSAAERRADSYWANGQYDQAMAHYVRACIAVGLRTRAGIAFRTAYDRLVGVIEKQLEGLEDPELQVRLADEGIRLWGQTPYVREHQQFVLACQRVRSCAQSRVYEARAETAFGERDYKKAFDYFIQACYAIGRVTSASYENYRRYTDIVSKIERRFYDLPTLQQSVQWSEYVEKEWHRLEQTISHPALLEACHRVQTVSRMVHLHLPNTDA